MLMRFDHGLGRSWRDCMDAPMTACLRARCRYMRHFPKISTLVQRCQELLAPIFLAQQEKEEARQGREASMEARRRLAMTKHYLQHARSTRVRRARTGSG